MAAGEASDDLYIMTPTEIAWGYLVGWIAADAPTVAASPAAACAHSPSAVLEEVLLEALAKPPCGVAFSGGRDSSVVLAVATRVARREGLPEPMPITRRFPYAAGTDESEWQELVVRHLGLDHWERLVLGDELDLVGPLAAPRLERHGIVWPPTVHGDIPLARVVRGGTLLDGEGGDEVFGVEAHRVAPLTALVRRPRPLRWRRLRAALGTMAPRSMRQAHARRHYGATPLTWLRPQARRQLLAEAARHEAAKPLSYARSVRMVRRRRTQHHLAHNRRILARSEAVDVRSPLLDPRFLDALAHAGGRLGPGDRTAALRAMFAEYLPDAVLSRTSKATFGHAFMGRPTREFVARWSGGGVQPEVVDPEELRRVWNGERPIALTAALLQQAWLYDHRQGG